MKRMLSAQFIPAIFVFIFMLPSLSFSAQQSRIALVIGNSSYKSSPLQNPANDASDMAVVLRKLGFSVQLKINANQRSMEKSIRTFGKELRSGGIGLFYYAGHGLQVDGVNYLIPVDADIETEADVKYESVDAGRVLAQMEEAENHLNIIILDACRDNPFTRSFRSAKKGLTKMDAPAGSIIAYSTSPGSVAADGSGRNGLYTSYMLEHMKEPGLKIEDMFKKVRLGVSKESGKKQTPWESSSLMGDFYFSTKRGISVVAAPSGKALPNEFDTELAIERKQLEQKRLELERLKMEVEKEKLKAERKRLEMEMQKPEAASLQEKPKSLSPVHKSGEIRRDGTLIVYVNRIVRDTNTGLEWIASNDRNVDWEKAKDWAESLTIDGGGWRMPTEKELNTLYKGGKGTRSLSALGNCVWGQKAVHVVLGRSYSSAY